MTWQELIRSSLRKINVLEADDDTALSGGMQNDSFEVLKAMIASLQLHPLLMFEERMTTAYSFTAGDGTYTIGPSGDISLTPRPELIKAAWARLNALSSPSDIRIRILQDQRDWGNIPVKTTPGPVPDRLWYQKTHPNGTINLYPVPSVTTTQLILAVSVPVSVPTDVTATFDLPAGFQEMLNYNLAIRLADEFGGIITPNLAQIANDTLAQIKLSNIKPYNVVIDPDMYRMTGRNAGIPAVSPAAFESGDF